MIIGNHSECLVYILGLLIKKKKGQKGHQEGTLQNEIKQHPALYF